MKSNNYFMLIHPNKEPNLFLPKLKLNIGQKNTLIQNLLFEIKIIIIYYNFIFYNKK